VIRKTIQSNENQVRGAKAQPDPRLCPMFVL
jgi:hypothetical protein